SSRRRHTRFSRDWSSDVCSSDLFTGSSIPAGCRFHSVSGASFGNEVSVLSAGQAAEARLESELEGEAAGEDGEAVSTGTDGAGAVGAVSGSELTRGKITSPAITMTTMKARIPPQSFQFLPNGSVSAMRIFSFS